jgi:hypothetical protein
VFGERRELERTVKTVETRSDGGGFVATKIKPLYQAWGRVSRERLRTNKWANGVFGERRGEMKIPGVQAACWCGLGDG